LNVVETWNSANGFIFFGRGGEVASNRLDDQEASVAALHLLQACLVYVNTLMLQRVLAEAAWRSRMTQADSRGLTPLVWGHVSPYGAFDLDMDRRLDLELREAASSRPRGPRQLVRCGARRSRQPTARSTLYRRCLLSKGAPAALCAAKDL
jgi:Tn3 transposase DDE domain